MQVFYETIVVFNYVIEILPVYFSYHCTENLKDTHT